MNAGKNIAKRRKKNMLKEKKGLIKYVVAVDSIETRGGWTLAQKENVARCPNCGGNIFYVRKEHGVVDESDDHEDLFREKDMRCYHLRQIGLALYCAECGEMEDFYDKFFHPTDKVVCSWDDEELEYGEMEEVNFALLQFNKTGKMKLGYSDSNIKYLQRKLEEYEKEHPKKINDPGVYTLKGAKERKKKKVKKS